MQILFLFIQQYSICKILDQSKIFLFISHGITKFFYNNQ